MTGRQLRGAEIRDAARALAMDPVSALRALVEAESETGNAAGIGRCCAVWASMLPPVAKVVEVPSTSGVGVDLLATLRGTGKRRLLLLGHVDTVPLAGCDGWRVEDGRAYGRGVFDMKGGLLLMAWVIEWLSARPDAYAQVSALVVSDEEQRSTPLSHVDQEWGEADACLAFEGMSRSSDGARRLLAGRYGGGVLATTVHGESCRAGLPLDGANPVSALGRLVAVIEAENEPESAVQRIPTRVRVETPLNVVADQACLDTVVRFRSRGQLQAYLDALPTRIGPCAVEYVWTERFPPLRPSERTLSAIKGAASIAGVEIETVTSTVGAADACWFGDSTPIVVDGLGPLGGGDHSASEFVWIDSFVPCTEVALAVTEASLTG